MHKYIESFADLKFRADFVKMALVRSSPEPLSILGPGEIWQNASGGIEFKIYTDKETYSKICHGMALPSPMLPGRIIPDNQKFSLSAINYIAEEWHADRIMVLNAANGLIYGKAEFIEHMILPYTAENDGTASFAYIIKDKLEFPCNHDTEVETTIKKISKNTSYSMDRLYLTHGKCVFHVFHNRQHTVARLLSGSSDDVTDETGESFLKTLEFSLGRRLHPLCSHVIRNGTHEIRLCATEFNKNYNILQPILLNPILIADDNDFENLFKRFFSYVDTKDSEHHSRLPYLIKNIMEVARSPLNIKALALAIAIEGLATQYLQEINADSHQIEDNKFEDDISRLELCIDKIMPPLIDSLKSRIGGFISSIKKSKNAQDKILIFIKKYSLDANLLKSWKGARNSLAHGSLIDKGNIEHYIKWQQELFFLFYSIIFHIVGYQGSRYDYSTLGYPIVKWPPDAQAITSHQAARPPSS